MKISSIVCEYNPFHNGHKFQIDKLRNTGVTHIVGIMSGHIMQRGDIACISKWDRTKMALSNGVDIIIELPTIFSNAPAENFAKGAISILDGLNSIDSLCFGSEIGNLSTLTKLANIIINMSNNSLLKSNLKSGTSYPKALSDTITAENPGEFEDIINKPNNTLGVEYIKSLINLNSKIKPVTLKRRSVGHDSEEIIKNYASASKIRELLKIDRYLIKDLIPKNTIDFYNNPTSNLKNIEKIILYKLKFSKLEDFQNLPYVSEGFENRLFKFSKSANSYEEFLNFVKTKRHTLAKIRRILFSLILDINTFHLKKAKPYARVLGATKNGLKAIKYIKSRSNIPIFMDYKSLNQNFYSQSILEKYSTDLFLLSSNGKLRDNIEYTHPLIII